MEKSKWFVSIEQNGGEYYGWIILYANSVERTGRKTLNVDGYEMVFGEPVEAYEKIDGPKDE